MIKKIKIAIAAYLAQDLEKEKLGGPSFAALALAKALAKDSCFDVHFITHSFSLNNPLKRNDNITFHFIPLPKKHIMPRQIRLIPFIIKKLDELNPDIIHVHSPNYSLAALKSRYPVVVTAHGLLLLNHNIPIPFKSYHLAAWIINLLWLNINYLFIFSPQTIGIKNRIINIYCTNVILFMLRRAKYLIVVSEYVKLKIRYLTAGKIFVVGNAVDKKYFNISYPSKDNRLLFVAANVTERLKDLMQALKVFKIIKQQVPDTAFHVAGAIEDSRYFKRIKHYLKRNSIEDAVIFMGQLKPARLATEYSNCTMLLSTSRFETFSLAIAQALSAGRPVVATKSGGVEYIIKNCKTGFIAEHDNVEKFAQRVLLLLNNNKLRFRLAKNAKSYARENFSQEVIGEKVKNIYSSILEREGQPKIPLRITSRA
jgi:glycosyltransferase involved in cell wall biosynthesis